MSIYLPKKSSKRKLKEAEDARKNRAEIVKALSQGQVSRRELVSGVSLPARVCWRLLAA